MDVRRDALAAASPGGGHGIGTGQARSVVQRLGRPCWVMRRSLRNLHKLSSRLCVHWRPGTPAEDS